MITSDKHPKYPDKTVYEVKAESRDPDEQAEVRMGKLFSVNGNQVHFTRGVGEVDLKLNDVPTDVKHPRSARIKSAVLGSKSQGAWVIIDGTTARLTAADVRSGLAEFETEAARHPGPSRGIRKVLVVIQSGLTLIEHDRDLGTGTSIYWTGHRLKM